MEKFMKTNNPRRTWAAGWIKAILFTPLLAYSVGLCAGDTKPAEKPAAPAAKAPAAKPAAAARSSPGGRGSGCRTRRDYRDCGPWPDYSFSGRRTRRDYRFSGCRWWESRDSGRRWWSSGHSSCCWWPSGDRCRRCQTGYSSTKAVSLRGGGEAHVDAKGRVTDLHRGGMDVHRGADGHREVRVEREDHSRIVGGRGRDGYVQGRYMYGGREYGHRTYYEHGRAYDRYYNRYPYHGVYLEGYAPRNYWGPAYYGWAYAPWAAPAPYAWGWVGNPWALYYGGYFTPYPVYASPAFWLTDYMISTTLAAAYQARVDAANNAAPQAFAGPPPAPLTPDVKNAISAEVQRQIALENAEAQQAARNAEPDPASSGVVRMLTDNTTHVFVAGATVDVINSGGQQCALTEGDVIQLNPAPCPPTQSRQTWLSWQANPRNA